MERPRASRPGRHMTGRRNFRLTRQRLTRTRPPRQRSFVREVEIHRFGHLRHPSHWNARVDFFKTKARDVHGPRSREQHPKAIAVACSSTSRTTSARDHRSNPGLGGPAYCRRPTERPLTVDPQPEARPTVNIVALQRTRQPDTGSEILCRSDHLHHGAESVRRVVYGAQTHHNVVVDGLPVGLYS